MDIHEFIKANKITMNSRKAMSNPNMADSDKMDNWQCRLFVPGDAMQLFYSKGVGHNGDKPTVDEVLDCLAMDASGVYPDAPFEEWVANYGYNVDSRSAEKTFNIIKGQAEDLRSFLGDENFRTLLEDIERL